MFNSKNTLPLGLIFLAIFSRLVPHPPNFTPFLAIAIFSGFQIKPKGVSILIPFIALFLSDLFLGFYSSMWSVYISIGLITYLSIFFNKNKTILTLGVTTLLGSFLFFMITNFSVWLQTTAYPKNWQGLSQCYMMAIPFFRNSVLGDVFYTSTIFLVYEIILKHLPKEQSYSHY